MGQDGPDIGLEPVVVDDRNEPIIVLLDSFFLILKTVNLSTGSACGKSARISWMLFHRALLATRYQRISEGKASGYLLPAATRRFFAMIGTGNSSPSPIEDIGSNVFKTKTVKL